MCFDRPVTTRNDSRQTSHLIRVIWYPLTQIHGRAFFRRYPVLQSGSGKSSRVLPNNVG